MVVNYWVSVERAMRFTFVALNERQRRICAASEALKLGHGGIGYLAQLLGYHCRTIELLMIELRQSDPPLPPQRAR